MTGMQGGGGQRSGDEEKRGEAEMRGEQRRRHAGEAKVICVAQVARRKNMMDLDVAGILQNKNCI